MKTKTIKRYHLKENVKESIKAVVICSICLILAILILNKLDEYNKKRAIENCNGKDNIIVTYDNNGDKIYTCKNEK